MKKPMKPWTWDELINIQQNGVGRAMCSSSIEDGVLGALAISVAKWHPDNVYRGVGFCGLCFRFVGPEYCTGCPLKKLWGKPCPDEGSLFDQWCDCESGGTDTANKIYNDLVKLYTDEYNKTR